MKHLLGLALASVLATASSTVTYNLQSDASSVTITQSFHGFSSTRMAVDVHDENGVKLATGSYSFSINPNSYTVSVSFPYSMSAGTSVRLTCCFAGSDTTASTDFKLEAGSGKLIVCNSCSSSNIAKRTYNGKVFVSEVALEFGYSFAPVVQTFVRAYIQDNAIVFGVSGPSSNWNAWSSGAHARVEYNINGFPAGVIQLGTATWNPGYWSSIADNRPIEFR